MRMPLDKTGRVRLLRAFEGLQDNPAFAIIRDHMRADLAGNDRALRVLTGEPLHVTQGRAQEQNEFLELCDTAGTQLAEAEKAPARGAPGRGA